MVSKDLADRLKETSANKGKEFTFLTLKVKFSLTEDRDKGQEASKEGGGDEDKDERVELIILGLLAHLLVQGVGGYRVVVVVEVPSGHRRSVLALKCEASLFFSKYLLRSCVSFLMQYSILLGVYNRVCQKRP